MFRIRSSYGGRNTGEDHSRSWKQEGWSGRSLLGLLALFALWLVSQIASARGALQDADEELPATSGKSISTNKYLSGAPPFRVFAHRGGVVFLGLAGFYLFWVQNNATPARVVDIWSLSVLTGVTFALWGSVAVWSLKRASEAKKRLDALELEYTPLRFSYAGYFAVSTFVALILLFRLPSEVNGLNDIESGAKARLVTFAIVGIFLAAPPVVLLWLVRDQLRRLRKKIQSPDCCPEEYHPQLVLLLELRQTLSSELGALGVILSAAALTVSWWLILLTRPPSTAHLSMSQMVLIGATITGLFAAQYASAVLSWRHAASVLVDAVYGIPEKCKLDQEWTAGRAELRQFLDLDVSTMRRISNAVVVLAPLAASLIPVIASSVS